jgi:hypothetical protein
MARLRTKVRDVTDFPIAACGIPCSGRAGNICGTWFEINRVPTVNGQSAFSRERSRSAR